MNRRTAARMRDPPRRKAAVTMEKIEAFLRSAEQRGCTAGTIQAYRRSLLQFYQALPPGKRLNRGTLARWRDSLLEQGCTARTVNAKASAINSFLEFLGLREYQAAQYDRELGSDTQPELNRAEYLRLLSAAREMGNERTYLLVKVFAVTGISVRELPMLTVEAVGDDAIPTLGGGQRRHIPTSLREELLAYIRRLGLTGGPVFVTQSGRPLARTAVTAAIHALARDAQVATEKCNPRCLRRLYQATMAGLEDDAQLLIRQAYDRLLEKEQRTVGWEEVDLEPC